MDDFVPLVSEFATQTCLQPLIHVTDQDQAQFDRVILRAQQQWNRTNATPALHQFATQCRSAFMSEYARDQPDSRLPPSVDTTMFVGPRDDYVQEICQLPRPPTDREREINRLRTMLIQPAWLTNLEVELTLRAIRMQVLDRYLPGPLNFDPDSGQLEPLTTDLPSVAGYTKVMFFITLNYQGQWPRYLKHPRIESTFRPQPHVHHLTYVDGRYCILSKNK